MMFIFQILILLGLVKLLDITNSPILCSGIYTAVAVLFRISFGSSANIFITGLIIFIGSSIYFWLLNKLQGTGLIRLIVAIAGVLFGFI